VLTEKIWCVFRVKHFPCQILHTHSTRSYYHYLSSHCHFRLLQERCYHKTRLTRSCKYGLPCSDKWLVDECLED